jgi:hypothetical protein
MYLLSASGTLDTILLLIIVWQVLRLILRLNARHSGSDGQHSSSEPLRPKGDVRIERVEEPRHGVSPPHVEDAEFEEIRQIPADEQD